MSNINSDQIRVLIPKNTAFRLKKQGEPNDSPGLFESNTDCEVSVTNSVLIFENTNDKIYFACQPGSQKQLSCNQIVPIMADDNNVEKIRVMNLEKLDEDYDTEICLANHEIICTDLKICQNHNLDFGRIMHDDGEILNFETLSNFRIDANHKITTCITAENLRSTIKKRELTIPNKSIVAFGNRKYHTCHDIFLHCDYSICSSFQYVNQFHLNNEVKELCADPFLKGDIRPKRITLQSNGVEFQVDAEIFAKKISACEFNSDFLTLTRGGKGDMQSEKLMKWIKPEAQENYQLGIMIAAITRNDALKLPEALSQKIMNLRNDYPSDYTDFVTRICEFGMQHCGLDLVPEMMKLTRKIDLVMIAIQLGRLDIVQHLYKQDIASTGAHDLLECAIKGKHLAVLQYLVTQKCPFRQEFAYYMSVAKDSQYQPIIKYLSRFPENIALRQQQLMQDVAKLQASFMNFRELLAEN